MEATVVLVAAVTTATMEIVGVLTIGASALLFSLIALRSVMIDNSRETSYSQLRASFGRGILLGLEFLVAADIIRTVAVTPTLRSLTVLAFIILIRTFLSISLRAEIDGGFIWSRIGRASASTLDLPRGNPETGST